MPYELFAFLTFEPKMVENLASFSLILGCRHASLPAIKCRNSCKISSTTSCKVKFSPIFSTFITLASLFSVMLFINPLTIIPPQERDNKKNNNYLTRHHPVTPLIAQDTSDFCASITTAMIQLPANEFSMWNFSLGTGIFQVMNIYDNLDH